MPNSRKKQHLFNSGYSISQALEYRWEKSLRWAEEPRDQQVDGQLPEIVSKWVDNVTLLFASMWSATDASPWKRPKETLVSLSDRNLEDSSKRRSIPEQVGISIYVQKTGMLVTLCPSLLGSRLACL